MNNKKRIITWHAFKKSGKWYASGEALIDSENYYFDRDQLLLEIDKTQNELIKGCIISREFNLVILGQHEDELPFINRMIPCL